MDKILTALKETLWFIPSSLLEGFGAAFILGALIRTFIPDSAVTKWMGKGVKKAVAYVVSAISGIALTICACGVIPLFTTLSRYSASIGIAYTFLYAAPAVNPMALALTYQLLGWKIATLRLLAAFFISIGLGLIIEKIFSQPKNSSKLQYDNVKIPWRKFAVFAELTLLLMFVGLSKIEVKSKFVLSALILISIQALSYTWLEAHQRNEWWKRTWGLTKRIIIPLSVGVFLIFLFKNYASEKLLSEFFGKTTWKSTFLAALLGAPLYFGTCVSIVFVKGLIDMGMATGPAVALLLSGPIVSFPTISALIHIEGWKRTLLYTVLVIVTSAVVGYIAGVWIGN